MKQRPPRFGLLRTIALAFGIAAVAGSLLGFVMFVGCAIALGLFLLAFIVLL